MSTDDGLGPRQGGDEQLFYVVMGWARRAQGVLDTWTVFPDPDSPTGLRGPSLSHLRSDRLLRIAPGSACEKCGVDEAIFTYIGYQAEGAGAEASDDEWDSCRDVDEVAAAQKRGVFHASQERLACYGCMARLLMGYVGNWSEGKRAVNMMLLPVVPHFSCVLAFRLRAGGLGWPVLLHTTAQTLDELIQQVRTPGVHRFETRPYGYGKGRFTFEFAWKW